MGAASTFFPMVIYAATSVRQVRPIHLEAARLLGANPWNLWTKVYMPAMLPYLWVGLRLGIAISIVGILLSETKMSQKGLGFLIIEYYTHFQITEMYAVLLLVFALAIAINSFLSWVQGRIPALRHGRQIREGMF
jgi:ABC-type nitrate/sulfonate/bicarbonate transport system permease component